MQNAARLNEVRSNNTVRLQKLIWRSDGISRAQLARDSGLSRSTVTLVVNELTGRGLVEESHLAASSGGRPPIVLKWVEDSHLLIGIDIGSSHITALIANMTGLVIQSRHVQIDVVNRPEETLSLLDEIISDFIAASPASVLGIGIALPCPVPTNGTDRLNAVILPKWKDVRLKTRLETNHKVPVFLDNDANLGALAELWWGKCKSVSDFAFVKLGTGVGAGIFSNGKLVRGKDGLSGEIGHIAISRTGPKCRCGQLGCLEAWIGKKALVNASRLVDLPLESAESPELSEISCLIEAFRSGEPGAVDILNRAIEQLGQALTPMIVTLNPSKLVFWGELTQLNQDLIDPLKQALQRQCLWQGLSNTDLSISRLGDEAMALGAFTLALDKVLKAPGLQLQSP